MLVCVSVSHRTADLDLLDRLSAAAGGITPGALIAGDAAGAVLLSTCNRVEAYLDVPPDAGTEAARRITDAFAASIGQRADEFRERAAVRTGREALRHLFSVTAGLESLAVGEEEIAGQVRRAYDAARAAGTTTPAIDRAFQRAVRVSREVRAATELGRRGRSLVQFALDLAGHRVTDWRTTRVLVVGTGNYAATTIASLRALGVAEISVYSATGRAEAFARRYGVVARRDLGTAIAASEVVVTCTRAYTIASEQVPADGARRLVIDLGMPRNVDPAVGEIPGVELLDLQLIAMHANLPELAPELAAREMVSSETARFAAEQLAAPAIVAIRRHVFDALDAEIERAASRARDPEAAELAAEALRHLAGVLLHTPSQRAREAAAAGRIGDFEAALGAVFGIDAGAGEEGRILPLPLTSGARGPADEDPEEPGDGAALGA